MEAAEAIDRLLAATTATPPARRPRRSNETGANEEAVRKEAARDAGRSTRANAVAADIALFTRRRYARMTADVRRRKKKSPLSPDSPNKVKKAGFEIMFRHKTQP